MLALTVVAGTLLLLTWGVYPLVVHALASFRPARSPVLPDPPATVTVVIATREDGDLVCARVRDALAADYPAALLNVVVAIDHAAAADLKDIDCREPRATIVRGDAPGGKAAALNAGVRAANGEILVFSDTHQRFEQDAIGALVRALGDPSFGAVSGQLELPETGHRSLVEQYWRFERRLRRDEARLRSAIGVSGSIYAMRRQLWAPLPAGLILDDLYIPMRLILGGHRVGFDASARAHDSRRTAAEQEFQRKVRTLTGNFQLCAWLPAVLLPWRNPVWLSFLLHKLLRLLTPWLGLALLVGVAGLAISAWGWWALATAAAVALFGVLLAELLGLRERLMTYLRWLWTMQAAVAVATINGLTGRWNVWRQ
ncbi:MAG TPA: glycosyltransferase [Gemmatimonadales bacterium]|jgi:cellulose synthase/poly-beta-1,6-N-acetylglucosamine synthase-like glycosyltransferase|nr:glycosyltransferase [Gemmatimonadales bacterium]